MRDERDRAGARDMEIAGGPRKTVLEYRSCWRCGMPRQRQIAIGGWQEVSPKPGTQPEVEEVVNLSGKVKGEELTWDAPAGNWTLLRFGCVTMAGHEYDVDVLDRTAVAGHFERMGKALLERGGAAGWEDIDPFLQRELGGRGADVDAEAGEGVQALSRV